MTPRMAGFKTEAAIFSIIDAARDIDRAEARAKRSGLDADAARDRAIQRFRATVDAEYGRLPDASRRVVMRRVLAALARCPRRPRARDKLGIVSTVETTAYPPSPAG